jgi:retron-type reverse transcriptase
MFTAGHEEIVDADLSGYFDWIPHAELMKSVTRRVVDGAMLHLIRCGWKLRPARNRHRTTRNRDEGRGTPQGSPISPSLSNLSMRRFVLALGRISSQQNSPRDIQLALKLIF